MLRSFVLNAYQNTSFPFVWWTRFPTLLLENTLIFNPTIMPSSLFLPSFSLQILCITCATCTGYLRSLCIEMFTIGWLHLSSRSNSTCSSWNKQHTRPTEQPSFQRTTCWLNAFRLHIVVYGMLIRRIFITLLCLPRYFKLWDLLFWLECMDLTHTIADV